MSRHRSMSVLGSLVVAALAGFAFPARPARAAEGAVLTPYDALATPSARTTLRFKVERDNFIRWDLRGVDVDFWLWNAGAARWAYLGRSRSGGDGYADLAGPAPASTGDHIVAGTLPQGGRYTASSAQILLAVRDPGARVVVTDIDWTIAAIRWDRFLFGSSASVPPVRGAVAALGDISRDATVVYLTARDDAFANRTRRWLVHWGFPRGPVICSDGVTMLGDPTSFKTAAIRDVRARFPNVLAGFGNQPTDHSAYVANGLWSYEWDTETRSFAPGTLVYHDWEDLRAAIRRGERPELAWARSYR